MRLNPFQSELWSQKVLFNYFWKFLKQPITTTLPEVLPKLSQFHDVTLPHDWLIYQSDNLYETSSGWYWKSFDIKKTKKTVYSILFEGVYMDCSVYVNGHFLGDWKNGYTQFEFDMTSLLQDGKNTIIVHVRHNHPNSRWYSGAGIFRNVWIKKRHLNHFITDGSYVHISPSSHDWTVDVNVEINLEKTGILRCAIYDNTHIVCESIKPAKSGVNHQTLSVTDPKVWSTDSPYLYRLETSLIINGITYDFATQSIGFKTIIADPNTGLWLNGNPMKIHGVCEHHDLGCLGSAFNRTVMKNRMLTLKEMGVNAIRTGHSIPAPEFMDLADELGLLICSDAFDIWHHPKNPYDYARFFDEWVEKDIASWVRRDRNHVSLLMWSIGNEIYDTHVDESSLEVTKKLIHLVKVHDPKQNGLITIASNFMMGKQAQACADALKIVGYNYLEHLYESHHHDHPDWMIFGSETGSIVQSRGIYHFPLETMNLFDDDRQCSSLGNSVTSWGAKSIVECIQGDEAKPYSLGQFIWTGFDYIGEPTPYDTKNSYFGQIDTAGFKKDSFYVYQSAWVDSAKTPMIHLFPYWQFNEGEIIDVLVATNASHFKLFLNDSLIDEKNVNTSMTNHFLSNWKIPYHKGVLKAKAYNKEGNCIAECVRSSFSDPVKIIVNYDRSTINADGKDVIRLSIHTVDNANNIVEDCRLPITIQVSSPGVLLGTDNGDSTDFTSYQASTKRLFSGKLSAFIGSTLKVGTFQVKIDAPNLDSKVLIFQSLPTDLSSEGKEASLMDNWVRASESRKAKVELDTFIPINRIELTKNNPSRLTKDHPKTFISAKIYPRNATPQSLFWKVVNERGVETSIADIDIQNNGCIVESKSDGLFYLRCYAMNKKSHPDVVSQIKFECTDIGLSSHKPFSIVEAGLFDAKHGEIGSGNEYGISTDNRSESSVEYHRVDFGNEQSDDIMLSVFAFDSQPQIIDLYAKDSSKKTYQLIDQLVYDLPTIWNVYQTKTFRLRQSLQGLLDIRFVFHVRNHFKGFQFINQKQTNRIIPVKNCTTHTGIEFQEEPWGFSKIGNNVVFSFEHVEIIERTCKIAICGRSLTKKTSIRIQVTYSNQTTEMHQIDFPINLDFSTETYLFDIAKDSVKIDFIFLPGSQFDFQWFELISN